MALPILIQYCNKIELIPSSISIGAALEVTELIYDSYAYDMLVGKHDTLYISAT